MVISILIFFIDLAVKNLSTSSSNEFDRTTLDAQLPTITAQLVDTLKNDESNEAILSKLDAPWNPEPFQEIPQIQEENTDLEDDKNEITENQFPVFKKKIAKKTLPKNKLPLITPSFKYTGFIDMGSAQIALINGTQYLVGDTISSYKVESIEAKKVILRSIETNVTIPIQISQ